MNVTPHIAGTPKKIHSTAVMGGILAGSGCQTRKVASASSRTVTPTHSPSHIAAVTAGSVERPQARRPSARRHAANAVSGSPSRENITEYASMSAGPAASAPIGEFPLRERVDLVLGRLVAEAAVGGVGRVHAERVLGHVAAVRPHQPARRRSLAQLGHDRRDRVHRVVVPRAATEREAAGPRPLPLHRVDAERLCAELDGRREARVEVDRVRPRRSTCRPVRARAARPARSPGCGRTCRGSTRSRARGSRSPECGNTQRSSAMPRRRAASTEHMISAAPMSTSLLEFISFGYGNPIIRFAGPTVVISSGDLRLADPRVRVAGGDVAEVGPQLAEVRLVLLDGAARSGAQRGLEHRVDLDRHDDADVRARRDGSCRARLPIRSGGRRRRPSASRA